MVEHAGDYEWRGEGEEAEVILYAPDERTAGSAFERILPAARLPGAESPVYGAASPEDLGWVAASTSHAAPDLTSVPARGLLLVADASLQSFGVPPRELPRRLAEVRVPRPTAAAIRRICEAGARAAAEDGLLEEEDLRLLDPLSSDADALGRRAISAGERDWDIPGGVRAWEVREVLHHGATESLGLDRGELVLVASAEAGELGRLALAGHRERVAARVRGGDFGAAEDLPAAPVETGETADLLAALHAAANFADGRVALVVYALRRAIGENLSLRAAWRVGGIESRGTSLVHRRDLAATGDGELLVSGGSVVAGTGKMFGSVPPFGDSDPWEEAGLLERWVELDPPEWKS